MSRTGSKRHYRVARKNIEEKQSVAFCMPKQKKHLFMAYGVLLLLVAFMKGIVIGMFLGKRD